MWTKLNPDCGSDDIEPLDFIDNEDFFIFKMHKMRK